MKPLHLLSGREKARLLHELFSEEIKELLVFIGGYSDHLEDQQAFYRSQWKHGLMTFEYWLSLAMETAVPIKKHGFEMKGSSKVFADQLYFGYTSLFVSDCIAKYAKRESTNEKFRLIVDAFFN